MVPSLSPSFLSLDLEVGMQNRRIHAFAAVRPDIDQPLVFRDGDLATALAKLDDFADGAGFLLGHNLIDFDLPHLKAAKPDLRLLKLPPIDTLRLNPLAFPCNPYHHLVKHYQDGQLKRGRINDPELDARLALHVFHDQQTALRDVPLGLLAAWHWLTGRGPDGAGFDAVFTDIREKPRPTDSEAKATIHEQLAGFACQNRDVNAGQSGWPLAYALAWLSVSGGNSVMPPWVRHQFPQAGALVRQLRDMPCDEADCDWCRERHDARKELTRWFGFDGFRPKPEYEKNRPMQQAIVEAAMAGEHVLGILPTGTGKSLCYQIPALSRYDKTGALTVVISPLVALMADQVAGLRKQNIDSCVTINGMLSMPERAEALDQVRLGDAGILIISPEQLRSTTVRRALDHLLACLPPKSQGIDLLVETTLGKLLEALTSDLFKSKNPERLLDRALLWLHEQEVIRLNKGLAVFRPAMTIRLAEEKRGFANTDFELLELHYTGQVLQIHVMAEFAERGCKAITDAMRMAMDYFTLKEEDFLGRWMPDRDKEIARETTPESWRTIVESLKNPIQQRIVADDRKQTNVLVLAGPGSGKTRVLVHRIAYLVRVKRENPRGILALAYNRHAAVEIRRRLIDLIGDDARGITVLTCHALAMRLVGISFEDREKKLLDEGAFREVLRQAVALLRGEGLEPEEADDQRERLLAGFRWILVDEYQDIGADQYELISALAGRTLNDADRKLNLFAVGDDDQNIYAFNGASVAFIRRFEADYKAKPTYLTDNYRSTGHIIEAANAFIAPARQRMKTGHPIHIDRARAKHPPGGDWDDLDSVAQGRVQILPAHRDPIAQARVAMTELQRLAALSPDWDWSTCAVIARKWKYLDPVRAFCERHRIPAQMGNEEIPSFWRLRETRTLVEWLRGRETRIVAHAELKDWLATQRPSPWNDLLRQALDECALETSDTEMPVDHFIEWLAEWGRDVRRRQRGLLLLTAHRAKGLEFDHIAVLDGGWSKVNRGEDPDAPRRLYYVAMTRARQTLALVRFQSSRPTHPDFIREPEPPAYSAQLHSLPFAFPNNGSTLHRTFDGLPPETADLSRQYRRPSLREIYLSFAGRLYPKHPIHRAIANLSPGDPLKTRIGKTGSWELLDQSGTVVGRLAQAFEPPPGTQCKSATVFAVVSWTREASEPPYRDHMKCDHWEVVVPELVFEPEHATHKNRLNQNFP